MRWKDVFVGAVASLAVSVIGGVVVYYFTKEPDANKTERLVYSVQQAASFRGGARDVAFTALSIENEGGVAAKHVTVLVAFKTAEIRDVGIEAGGGSRETARQLKANTLQITYESLLPNETITLALLLSAPEKPVVSVRSDATLGIERPADSSVSPRTSKINRVLQYMVPLTGALVGVMTVLGAAVARRSGLLETVNKNNAGFLMLHYGLADDALLILSSALRAGRYDAYTLSNLALCHALKGQHEYADGLIRAAKFRPKIGHAASIILFNEGLIALNRGQKETALNKLRQAYAISPARIRKYCKESVLLDSVRADAAFDEFFKDE